MGCWCRGTKFLWREGSVGGAKEIERNCIDKVRVLNAVALHCIASSLSSSSEEVRSGLAIIGLVNCHGGGHILSGSDHLLVTSTELQYI